MSRARILLLSSLVVVTGITVLGQVRGVRRQRNPTGERKEFSFGGQDRAYRIHVPDSYDASKPTALTLFLHGGGGNAEIGSKTGMTPVADKHGFIVVYPEGIDKHWNDGRRSELFAEHDKTIDDVAFLTELVDRMKQQYTVDPHRVFIAGPSNGGFMSQRMAIERSGVFSAAGILIATMAEPLKAEFKPAKPVSVLFMNGTADPMVPYKGGPVRVNLFPKLARFQRKQPNRGECISTNEAVELWLARNQLAGKTPRIEALPDKDPDDGCTVQRKTWTGGESDTTVALYRIVGGGHTIPGGVPYLPEAVIGKTNRDISAMETLWEFFSQYNRQPSGVDADQSKRSEDHPDAISRHTN